MKSRRNIIGSLGVVLLLACSCTTPKSIVGSDRVGAARYLDPRLFEADIGEYGHENIFVHAKMLNIEHVIESEPGPYSLIYATAEVRDSDTNVPVLIQVSDRSRQSSDIQLLVGECYRFYTYVGFDQPIIDPETGAKRTLPVLSGYHFEPLAHDGVGGCESP